MTPRGGVLVGGASAGRVVASESGHVELAVMSPVRMHGYGSVTMDFQNVTVTRERYMWRPLGVGQDGVETGVWAHESLVGDRGKVLRELIEGYRPLARESK